MNIKAQISLAFTLDVISMFGVGSLGSLTSIDVLGNDIIMFTLNLIGIASICISVAGLESYLAYKREDSFKVAF